MATAARKPTNCNGGLRDYTLHGVLAILAVLMVMVYQKQGSDPLDNKDTSEQSLEHWSEAGRREMEYFYEIATVDYKHLAEAIDWKAWFEVSQKAVGSRRLRLLDVACGSGKWPAAIVKYTDVERATVKSVDYALLDPSGFSISEVRNALASPFTAGAEFEMPLQDLDCDRGAFDIVWATHALYAIAQGELETALGRFVHAMRHSQQGDGGGVGFIAHASDRSFYLQFYKHYLEGFKKTRTPYSSSEEILAVLTKMGVAFETKEITYTGGGAKIQESAVEGYLQRCLFDDTLSLADMMANPITGPYLETCRKDGHWQFTQYVTMIFLKALPEVPTE